MSNNKSYWQAWHTLKTEFGGGLLFYLFSNYFFIKGFTHVAVSRIGLPYLRDALSLPVQKTQIARAVYQTPFSCKGILGAQSDIFAPFGYNKRSFILLFSIFGTIAATVLALTPPTKLSFITVTLLFCIIELHAANSDTLCEGKYTSEMTKKPETGALIPTFVWLMYFSSSFLASAWIGVASDYLPLQVTFYAVIFCCFQQVLVTCYPFHSWKYPNLLDDPYIEKGNRILFTKAQNNRRFFLCALSVSLIAIGSIGVGITGSIILTASYSIATGLILLYAIFRLLPSKVSKPVMYIFLSYALCPSISSQIDYFMLADEQCVPNGPHFSYTYYITIVSVCSSLLGLVGVYMFHRIVSQWNFQKAFWLTAVFRMVASLFDVAIVMRWNLFLGIGDRAWFLLSNAMVESILEMLHFMPSVVLISRLCPKSLESTMYAIVAGVSNFGNTFSSYTGNAMATYIFKIHASGNVSEACNFKYLPLAVAITGCILPIFPVILTFFMIPDASMSTHLVDEVDILDRRAEMTLRDLEGGYASLPQNKIGRCLDELNSNSENQESAFLIDSAGVKTEIELAFQEIPNWNAFSNKDANSDASD